MIPCEGPATRLALPGLSLKGATMADFGMRQRFRENCLDGACCRRPAGAGLALGVGVNRLPASAQEITYSRDYEGTTLNCSWRTCSRRRSSRRSCPSSMRRPASPSTSRRSPTPSCTKSWCRSSPPGRATAPTTSWRSTSTGSTNSPAPGGSRISGSGSPTAAGRWIWRRYIPAHARHRLPRRWQDLLRPHVPLPDGPHLPRRPPRRRGVQGRVQGEDRQATWRLA